jgi:predicted GIY-YIG superfamily endonuclease
VTAGVVYLLHLDAPGYAHAKHYTGWTADLPARLALHEAGQGARLLAVAHAAGIGWTLARTWPGTRARERQLKRQGGASRRCPLCGVTPRAGGNGHAPFDSRSDAAPGAAGQRRGLSHART